MWQHLLFLKQQLQTISEPVVLNYKIHSCPARTVGKQSGMYLLDNKRVNIYTMNLPAVVTMYPTVIKLNRSTGCKLLHNHWLCFPNRLSNVSLHTDYRTLQKQPRVSVTCYQSPAVHIISCMKQMWFLQCEDILESFLGTDSEFSGQRLWHLT